jgi:GTPase
LVVTGIVLRGTISVGDHLMLGPFAKGDFRKVRIRSIHVHRTNVKRAYSGQTASLSFKHLKRPDIRKGMALVDVSLKPVGCLRFEAEVNLLDDLDKTPLQGEPVLHIGTVNQSARVVEMDEDSLKKAGSGKVTFEFRHQSEYIRVGAKVIFREGRTKGVGTVSRIVQTFGGKAEEDEDLDIEL